jgi:hypothetical protein
VFNANFINISAIYRGVVLVGIRVIVPVGWYMVFNATFFRCEFVNITPTCSIKTN